MTNKKKLLGIFIFLFITTISKADPIVEGKTIFTSRCAACHNVNKVLVGPALGGVDQRHTTEWIINFVHSSQTMVKKGDKDAVALFQKFNNIPMPDHPDLTENDIKGIIEYIKSEAKPIDENKPPFPKPLKMPSNAVPLSISADSGFFVTYFLAIGTLISVLLFAVKVTGSRNANEKEVKS
jgi:cytochrome c551/c552